MQNEINRIRRAIEIQAELDEDEYVQQFIIRIDGPPSTYRSRQTRQKLDEINRKCGIDFDGKSFIDLGCNKGFFPLYAAARGAYRAVGVDPGAARIERARSVAKLARIHAEFVRSKFETDMIDRLGVFDIVYVGSAYHYFWLDYRDHETVFAALAAMTGEVLIFEGCTSLDDDQWRIAAINTTGEDEASLRKQFNDDAILAAAKRHFDVEPLGRSGHATHRYLFNMRKPRPSVGKATAARLREQPVTHIAGKAEGNRAGNSVESVSVIELDGERYIKKLLSKNRLWCEPAIKAFERAFQYPEVYPPALCRHIASERDESMIVLYQAFEKNAVPLSRIPGPLPAATRQQLLHGVFSMQRELLSAGLIHIDIHETNILMTPRGPCVIDFEGLVLAASDAYRGRFAEFHTLNFLAFVEKALFGTKVTRNSIHDLPGMELYGPRTPEHLVPAVMAHLECRDPEVRFLYREVLADPSLLTNVDFYHLLLRELPARIGRPAVAEPARDFELA